jgi:hypothetical protein
MKTAVAFLTKYPHVNLIKFAEEVESIGFDVFIVSDDFCESKNIVYIDDAVCLWQGYVNAHIWENSPTIKKQVTAWDKMLYLFCEDETKYDFIWVFEDDVFIPSAETIQLLQMKYKNYHLVVPNNFKSSFVEYNTSVSSSEQIVSNILSV